MRRGQYEMALWRDLVGIWCSRYLRIRFRRICFGDLAEGTFDRIELVNGWHPASSCAYVAADKT